MTAVQDCVSPFVVVNPGDILKETSGKFPAIQSIFVKRSPGISSHVCGKQNSYFKAKHDLFPFCASTEPEHNHSVVTS